MIRAFILSLLLAGVACAGQGTIPSGHVVTVSAGASCGSLTFAGAPGDTETFENSAGTFCTGSAFAETDPNSIINTYATAQYKNGTHSAYFGFTGAEAEVNYIRADIGSTDTGFSLTYWIRPGSLSSWTNESIFSMSSGLSSSNGSANALVTLLTDQNGGSQFKVRIYNYSGGNPTTGTVNYNINSWVKLEYLFRSGGTSDVKVYNSANVLQETITVLNTPSLNIRYLYWGDVFDTIPSTYIRSFYIDDIQYNSTNP